MIDRKTKKQKDFQALLCKKIQDYGFEVVGGVSNKLCIANVYKTRADILSNKPYLYSYKQNWGDITDLVESFRNEHKSDPVDKVASSFALDCYMKLSHGIQEGWLTLID